MSNLTGAERLCLESIFWMDTGNVLDLSDSDFERFFESYDIDIHCARYQINGPSNAKKMHTFWDLEPDELVARVLSDLLDFLEVLYFPAGEGRDLSALRICRAISARLLKVSFEEGSQIAEFSSIEEIELPDVQELPGDSAVTRIIQDRLEEARTCQSAGADLAVIFLCGSVLEAVLLGAAQENPETFNRSTCSPKKTGGKVKDFRDWSLSQLIDVAFDIGLLKPDSRRFSHALRDFRNYIHPEQQLREDFKPDAYTSEGCFQALKTALADLSNAR